MLAWYSGPVVMPPDRRQRRKQRTRSAIEQAALELFAEQGFAATTIAAIAEAADVAPRTVTLHFPAKEDLLFAEDPFAAEALAARVRTRAPGETTLDALRDWMATTMAELGSAAPETQRAVWRTRALRAAVISGDDTLRGRARSGYHASEQIIAEGIGADSGQPADALAPRLAAIVAVTGLRELYMTREISAGTTIPGTDELLVLVDRVLDFTRAGLSALSAPSERPGAREARPS
jgi:AcrR family transcriptional regulator